MDNKHFLMLGEAKDILSMLLLELSDEAADHVYYAICEIEEAEEALDATAKAKNND